MIPSRVMQRQIKEQILCIAGPTASGKSSRAVEEALARGGEVISVDSRQVYRGLNIGTGKITKREIRGVRHHLLDVASPRQRFTAARFKKIGQKAIKEIFKEELPTWAFLTLLFLSFLYFKNKKYFDKSPEEGMVL